MSAAPFDIDLVIERVRISVPELRQVRGAADYAQLKTLRDLAPPEAFVLLARERGKPGTHGSQAAAVSFGVVIAVRNQRGQRGKPAMDDAVPLIGAVRSALIGWTPTLHTGSEPGRPIRGGRPCQWLQGDTLDYDANTLLWSDVFTTQHFIGS